MKLSSIHQAKTLIISGMHSTAFWQGRSVQSAVNIARSFSNKKDEEKDSLPVHLRPPPGKPIEVPDYLKKGHPYEISIRSGPIRNDDPRTEEEREKEFWDRVEKASAKGLILTADNVATVYPDSPYAKKSKDNKENK